MKKTILLVTILSLLFLFSSCDPILEILFPEATGGGDKPEDANNTIQVGVNVDWTIFDSDDYRFCWVPIIIQLQVYDNGMGEYVPMENREFWCHRESFIYERFEWIPPGQFRVVAFFDENVNYELDDTDSAAIGWDNNVQPKESFVPVQNGGWYNLDANLTAGVNETLSMP